jgi:hypothetical protein
MENLLLQAVAKKLLNESLSPAEYERKLKELQTELFIKIKRAREDFIIKKKKLDNSYFNY